MTYQLGVASSVSREQGFDAQDALTYTLTHQFTSYQPYLNERLLADIPLRQTLRQRCEAHHITLIAHAPASLNQRHLTHYHVEAAAKDLFGPGQKPRIIHHYDETISLEESLSCLKQVQQAGLVPCLENFFLLGAQTAGTCFKQYLRLLLSAQKAGLEVPAVFDIPRLYHQRLGLRSQQISALLDEAVEIFAALDIPLLLHLIDVTDAAQERSSWCPVGQGIIPYGSIFASLKQAGIAVSHVILEYEDKVNTLASLAFLHAQLGTPSHSV